MSYTITDATAELHKPCDFRPDRRIQAPLDAHPFAFPARGWGTYRDRTGWVATLAGAPFNEKEKRPESMLTA